MSIGLPVSESAAGPVAAIAATPLTFLRAAWEWWKKIARAVGVVQTRLLMVCFYFVFVFPLGLVMRMSGDPLHLKRRSGSNWAPHREQTADLETARRQF